MPAGPTARPGSLFIARTRSRWSMRSTFNTACRRGMYTIAPNGGGPVQPADSGHAGLRAGRSPQNGVTFGANSGNSGGYGLPFAYDPLWRYQTLNPVTGINGYYLGDGYANPGVIFEARFGSGIGFIRADPSDGGSQCPSAHGLQRITNFNRPFLANGHAGDAVSSVVPSIFVSPEDVVWVEYAGLERVQPGAAGPEPAVVRRMRRRSTGIIRGCSPDTR